MTSLAAPDDAVADPTDHASGGSGAGSGGVLLRLGASRYAVALPDVAEVAPIPTVTRLPGSPPWLPGVANWRGRMLPVLDLRPLLGTEVVPLATSARLLVLAKGDVVVALVAELVPGTYDGSLHDCLPPPATLRGEAARLVIGQVCDSAGPIAVLDVEAVIALRDRLDRRRSGS